MSEPATALDLVCLGEPMLELNLQNADRTGGRTYLEAHGGDASNVAVAAARQGARAAFLTAVGDDPAGRSFFELWRRERVDAQAVRVDPDHPTGLYFVSHDAEGHHFSYLRRGSAASHYQLDAAARAQIEQARVVLAAGISLGISEGAADTVFDAMALARSAGARVAFDTNYRPKLWPPRRASAVIGEAMRQADIVFPGFEDIQMLLGLSDPDTIVDHVLAQGPGIVVLKMGHAGALLATPERRWRIPPFPCSPVDATGAGDAFCGSFLAVMTQGENLMTEDDDLKEAARYAACAAALATTSFGAVPPIPTRGAVLRALAQQGGAEVHHG